MDKVCFIAEVTFIVFEVLSMDQLAVNNFTCVFFYIYRNEVVEKLAVVSGRIYHR